MKYSILLIPILLISLHSKSNNIFEYKLEKISQKADLLKDTSINEKWSTVIIFQSLRSTHANFFNGIGASIYDKILPKLTLGLGSEYSSTPLHNDNNWVLTKMRVFPVFISSKYNLSTNARLLLYFHLATGLSFLHYQKEDQNTIGYPYPVSERGLYLYSGIGSTYKLSKSIFAILDLGFKGYHMSTYALDVNPHGICMQAGIEF